MPIRRIEEDDGKARTTFLKQDLFSADMNNKLKDQAFLVELPPVFLISQRRGSCYGDERRV
jgi:hypothetical protein